MMSRSNRNAKKLRDGFDLLRTCIPTYPCGKALSKIATLRSAMQYIQDLCEILDEESTHSDEDPSPDTALSGADVSQTSTSAETINEKAISRPSSSQTPAMSVCSDESNRSACASPASYASSVLTSSSIESDDASSSGSISGLLARPRSCVAQAPQCAVAQPLQASTPARWTSQSYSSGFQCTTSCGDWPSSAHAHSYLWQSQPSASCSPLLPPPPYSASLLTPSFDTLFSFSSNPWDVPNDPIDALIASLGISQSDINP